MCFLRVSILATVLLSAAAFPSWSQIPSTRALELDARIPLGDISGRIDHLAVDLGRQRLFVAELGNDTLGVVDLTQRRVVLTLKGLREPQGIGYVRSTDTLFVANGSDGTVRFYQGAELLPAGQLALGDDADNVRVDDEAHEVWVGYGSGALAVVDAMSRRKVADIALDAHPESFRFEPNGHRIFVNVPGAGEITVVDRAARRVIAHWPNGALASNFPLAIDASHHRVLSVFRRPAVLALYDPGLGKRLATIQTCGDSDDAFIDGRRNRVYVICGAGYVDVFAPRGDTYERVSRIETRPGARTGLFVPELDRLYVAARARGSSPAAIWEFRPQD